MKIMLLINKFNGFQKKALHDFVTHKSLINKFNYVNIFSDRT